MSTHHNRCAQCGVRDHALGGRARTGAFLLALPISGKNGRTAWPRIGTNGWCGTADGEVERLTIMRISLARHNGHAGLLCQHCFAAEQAQQGMFLDLFHFSPVNAPAAT